MRKEEEVKVRNNGTYYLSREKKEVYKHLSIYFCTYIEAMHFKEQKYNVVKFYPMMKREEILIKCKYETK